MKKLVLLLLVIGCSGMQNKKTVTEKFNIYENLSFNEFKLKIINYSKNSDFPNIKD